MKRLCVFSRRREQGVALLFALGMLSLLMVMGLAFVSTSILAQRVAMNNSHRAEARSLAKAAINRIALSALSYQYSLADGNYKSEGVSAAIPWDLSSVYSKSSTSSDDFYLKQGLRGNEKSGDYTCLSYPDIDGDIIDLKESSSEAPAGGTGTGSGSDAVDSGVQWIYMRNGNDSTDEIIGRIAFRVLPSEEGLPLPYVFTGAIDASGGKAVDYMGREIQKQNDSGTTATTASLYRNPWANRWGQDINELCLYQHKALESSDGWWNNCISCDLESFFNANDDTYPSLKKEESRTGKKLTYEVKNGRKWFLRWFSDGFISKYGENTSKNYRFQPSADESWEDRPLGVLDKAPSDKIAVYHRFNLGREKYDSGSADDWYSRLGLETDSQKNSEDAINRLTCKGAAEYTLKEKDLDVENDSPYYKNDVENRGGIPALRLTGDDQGSFSSLENRRKQIAANLNDYCDADSIPTVKEEGDKILYAGNEKTLYINEVGIGAVISSKPSNTDLAIELQLLKPGVLAELVDIYGTDQNGNAFDARNDHYSFETKLYLSAKVIVTPSVTIKYRTAVGKPFREYSCNLSPSEQTILCGSESSPLDVNIDSAKWIKSGVGYWAGKGQSTESSEVTKVELLEACKDALKSKYPTAIYGSAAITEYKIKLDSVSFNLGRMTLKVGSGASGSTPVDYVNAPDKKFDNISVANPAELKISNGKEVKSYLPFLIGRMEAKDPRQNLNINVDHATLEKCQNQDSFQKSDWFFEPRVRLPLDSSGVQKELDLKAVSGTSATEHFMSVSGTLLPGSQSSSGNVDGFDKMINLVSVTGNAGVTNLFGNPANPLANQDTSLSGTKVDREIATDVAWKGEERDQHISTAYIRNAPMCSPWELGAIHRGAAWETLNISKASSGQLHSNGGGWDEAGRKYENGDAILLDQVKMVPYARSMGKINLNHMQKDAEERRITKENDEVRYLWMGKALFNYLLLGQQLHNFSTDVRTKPGDAPKSQTLKGEWKLDSGIKDDDLKKIFWHADGQSWLSSRAAWLTGSQVNEGLTSLADFSVDQQTDAEKEEIVGKVINLLDTRPMLSRTFKAIVIAQTIKDIGGEASGSGEKVSKVFGKEQKTYEQSCKIGTFDIYPSKIDDQYLYFDEITGEVKMIVTFHRDPETGRVTVQNTEYID